MLDENQTRVTYADRKVDSLCPFCGVGCQVTYEVKDEKVIYAEGRDGPATGRRRLSPSLQVFEKIAETQGKTMRIPGNCPATHNKAYVTDVTSRSAVLRQYEFGNHGRSNPQR